MLISRILGRIHLFENYFQHVSNNLCNLTFHYPIRILHLHEDDI